MGIFSFSSAILAPDMPSNRLRMFKGFLLDFFCDYSRFGLYLISLLKIYSYPILDKIRKSNKEEYG